MFCCIALGLIQKYVFRIGRSGFGVLITPCSMAIASLSYVDDFGNPFQSFVLQQCYPKTQRAPKSRLRLLDAVSMRTFANA